MERLSTIVRTGGQIINNETQEKGTASFIQVWGGQVICGCCFNIAPDGSPQKFHTVVLSCEQVSPLPDHKA